MDERSCRCFGLRRLSRDTPVDGEGKGRSAREQNEEDASNEPSRRAARFALRKRKRNWSARVLEHVERERGRELTLDHRDVRSESTGNSSDDLVDESLFERKESQLLLAFVLEN